MGRAKARVQLARILLLLRRGFKSVVLERLTCFFFQSTNCQGSSGKEESVPRLVVLLRFYK